MAQDPRAPSSLQATGCDVFTLKIELLPLGCFDPSFGFFDVLLLQTLGTIGVALLLVWVWRNYRIRGGCCCGNGVIKSDETDEKGSVAGEVDDNRDHEAQSLQEQLLSPHPPAVHSWSCLCFWASIEDMPTRSEYASYAITFVKLVLPVVSLEIAQAFRCSLYHTGGGNTKEYLVADYAINCRSRHYNAVEIYAFAMTCLLPVGMPILGLVALWRLRCDDERRTETRQ